MTEAATVLVVEDERELADLFANWLESAYDVRTAYDADGALEHLDDDVDVVLLDRRLPERTGDEVLESIGEHGYDCQVAMVTAVDPDFDVLELGFDAYAVKPVEREELQDLVERLLARSLYSGEVQEYFSLASRRAALETSKSQSELEGDERYERACEKLEGRRETLDALVSDLDERDFLAVLHDLNDDDDGTPQTR